MSLRYPEDKSVNWHSRKKIMLLLKLFVRFLSWKDIRDILNII